MLKHCSNKALMKNCRVNFTYILSTGRCVVNCSNNYSLGCNHQYPVNMRLDQKQWTEYCTLLIFKVTDLNTCLDTGKFGWGYLLCSSVPTDEFWGSIIIHVMTPPIISASLYLITLPSYQTSNKLSSSQAIVKQPTQQYFVWMWWEKFLMPLHGSHSS